MESGSINVQINKYASANKDASMESLEQDESELNLNLTSGSEDEEGRKKIKRLPGETKEQAIERYEKTKEMRRLKKLMKYAYPR